MSNVLSNQFSHEILSETEGQAQRCKPSDPLLMESDRLDEDQHASEMEITSKTVCDAFN